MQIEATSEVESLIERNSSVKLLLDNKRKEVQELQQTSHKALADARRILTVCQQLMNTEDADFNAFLNSLPSDAPGQQMEDEISSEKARLELMHEGNGGVIKEYEQRQRKVESLKAKAAECKHALDELQDKIKEIREHWEPELDKLVEKISRSFSYNMGQINCAGEVGIFKDEQDFDEWAIQIRVKFRYVQATSDIPSLCTCQLDIAIGSLQQCSTKRGLKIVQRKRTPHHPRFPPPVRWRTRRLHNLLPHVPPVPHPLSLPRRRRNQPRHGPPQRAPSPQAHGQHSVRHR